VLSTNSPTPIKTALEKGAKGSFTLPKGKKPADVAVAVLVEDGKELRTLESVFVDVTKKPDADKKKKKRRPPPGSVRSSDPKRRGDD
jgi:hypothetical protein